MFPVHWQLDCLEFKLPVPKETMLEMMDWLSLQVSKGESTESSPGPSCLQGESQGWSVWWGNTEGQDCSVSRNIQQGESVGWQVGEGPSSQWHSILGSWQWPWGGIRKGGPCSEKCQHQGRLSKWGRPDGTSNRHIEDPCVHILKKATFRSVGN